MTFEFELSEDYQKWFDNQLEELVLLYGEQSEFTENVFETMNSKIYRWDTDTTSLQFVLIKTENTEPRALLGVLNKDYQGVVP